MKTDIPGVYAAGDIVEFPLFSMGDKNVNIQHWQMANKHGKKLGLLQIKHGFYLSKGY